MDEWSLFGWLGHRCAHSACSGPDERHFPPALRPGKKKGKLGVYLLYLVVCLLVCLFVCCPLVECGPDNRYLHSIIVIISLTNIHLFCCLGGSFSGALLPVPAQRWRNVHCQGNLTLTSICGSMFVLPLSYEWRTWCVCIVSLLFNFVILSYHVLFLLLSYCFRCLQRRRLVSFGNFRGKWP